MVRGHSQKGLVADKSDLETLMISERTKSRETANSYELVFQNYPNRKLRLNEDIDKVIKESLSPAKKVIRRRPLRQSRLSSLDRLADQKANI